MYQTLSSVSSWMGMNFGGLWGCCKESVVMGETGAVPDVREGCVLVPECSVCGEEGVGTIIVPE